MSVEDHIMAFSHIVQGYRISKSPLLLVRGARVFQLFFFFVILWGRWMNIFFFFSFIIGSVDFDENTLHSDYIYRILMINCHLKCVSFTYTTHVVAQLWILMFASTLVCNACYIYFFFYSYATLKI